MKNNITKEKYIITYIFLYNPIPSTKYKPIKISTIYKNPSKNIYDHL